MILVEFSVQVAQGTMIRAMFRPAGEPLLMRLVVGLARAVVELSVFRMITRMGPIRTVVIVGERGQRWYRQTCYRGSDQKLAEGHVRSPVDVVAVQKHL